MNIVSKTLKNNNKINVLKMKFWNHLENLQAYFLIFKKELTPENIAEQKYRLSCKVGMRRCFGNSAKKNENRHFIICTWKFTITETAYEAEEIHEISA